MSILKTTFIFILFHLFSQLAFAQTHQIALVKPDGTTTIHTTFQSAYDAAEDDDKIYLPGGNINQSLDLHKKLFIYGAGINLDSSIYTLTSVISSINFGGGADGGSIEGIHFNGICHFLDGGSGYTIKNCYFGQGLKFYGSGNDSWNNVSMINNVFYGFTVESWTGYYHLRSIEGDFDNSLLSNNIIQWHIVGTGNSTNNIFLNNIFLKCSYLPSYSNFGNNIFPFGTQVNVDYSSFLNNVNCSVNGTGNIIENGINEEFIDIFIEPGELVNWTLCCEQYMFSFNNNYHIKETSQCKNSGTDGTDRGIYGGGFPWQDGSFPANPHIYYKNIPAMTNPNGNLQINVNVKAQDN